MNISNRAVKTDSPVIALLGPTNTGKTHYAVDRMLSYHSGMIGFPLRLLARENYDRLVKQKGEQAVALVTGEEKIIPPHARYFSCTVESMPLERKVDFLAVDEIQMCADPDRGHIFTDRLLHARGRQETMFLGAETIRPVLAYLVSGVEFMDRPRLSTLTYTGYKKLTRLPKRSAVVAFSVDDLYQIADLLRRQRGGTAVVLGALSPRARNAQVAMYQAGEVDFIVATDAIGMGLNMDISHVALAETWKYDGQRPRPLSIPETAQIAGRAGRYMKDGTFGVTEKVRELDPDMVDAIEAHRFESLGDICWRNSALDFETPLRLLQSLERGSGVPVLVKGRPADDYLTLQNMMGRDDVMALADSQESIALLWDVCQIPDFRKTLTESHPDLVSRVYGFLTRGKLPADWMEDQIRRIDNIEGDVDTLMARIANIRTWTYISHRPEWLEDPRHWQSRAHAIEDRLSDALHEGLTSRFVDRRSSVLMKSLHSGALLGGVRKDGEVVVEGQSVGHLEGFRFIPDNTSGRMEHKAVMAAARHALRPELQRRIKEMLTSEPKQFRLMNDGTIAWQSNPTNPLPGVAVARVVKGDAMLLPRVELGENPLLETLDKTAVQEKLQEWLKAHIATVLETLVALNDETGLSGAARGIAFQIYEALGIIERSKIEDLIAGLEQDGRAQLRAKRVRLGPILVFLPTLNKPAAVQLRALLWSLWHDRPLPAPTPKDGMVSQVVDPDSVDKAYYQSIGYPVYGKRAIRVDMLDRVIAAIYEHAEKGTFRARHEMAEWLGCPIAELYDILEAMGHRKIEDAPQPEAKSEAAAASKEDEVQVVTEAPAPAAEAEPEKPAEEPAAVAETAETAPVVADAPKPVEKPVLALFRIRRAHQGGKPREGQKFDRKPKPEQQRDRKDREPRKDFDKDKKPFRKKHDRKDERREERQPRVISAGKMHVSEDDSPFAILKQLKVGDGK